MNLYDQLFTFSLMLLCGLGLGLLFDACKVLAERLHVSRWIVAIMDVGYWLGATWLVFKMMLLGNDGQFRLYVFLGLALGAIVYALAISRYAVGWLDGIYRAIVWAYQMILRILHGLIVRPLKGIYRLILGLLGLLVTITVLIVKVVLQLLYPFWAVIRWLFRPLAPLLTALVKVAKKWAPGWLTRDKK